MLRSPTLVLAQAAVPEAERGIATDWIPGALLVLLVVGFLVWLKWYHLGRKVGK
jgi:hypothetical protein